MLPTRHQGSLYALSGTALSLCVGRGVSQHTVVVGVQLGGCLSKVHEDVDNSVVELGVAHNTVGYIINRQSLDKGQGEGEGDINTYKSGSKCDPDP